MEAPASLVGTNQEVAELIEVPQAAGPPVKVSCCLHSVRRSQNHRGSLLTHFMSVILKMNLSNCKREKGLG